MTLTLYHCTNTAPRCIRCTALHCTGLSVLLLCSLYRSQTLVNPFLPWLLSPLYCSLPYSFLPSPVPDPLDLLSLLTSFLLFLLSISSSASHHFTVSPLSMRPLSGKERVICELQDRLKVKVYMEEDKLKVPHQPTEQHCTALHSSTERERLPSFRVISLSVRVSCMHIIQSSAVHLMILAIATPQHFCHTSLPLTVSLSISLLLDHSPPARLSFLFPFLQLMRCLGDDISRRVEEGLFVSDPTQARVHVCRYD